LLFDLLSVGNTLK